jgi:hypothetical protein
MEVVFALIHSPLVGPLTWSLVAAELKNQGVRTVVPVLSDTGGDDRPFWSRQAESAARGIARLAPDAAIVLVGHSGAGAILPAIRELLTRQVSGYLFVDAGLPNDGLSRIEMMEEEDAEFARSFREYLNAGGIFPTWTDEDLSEVVPDSMLRRGLIEELCLRDLAFFTEPIPVFAGWPDAPCGYVRLSAAYDVPFRQARASGWPWRELDGGHFQMLVEPKVVAEAMTEVVAGMGIAL